jgi:hypothetical protein
MKLQKEYNDFYRSPLKTPGRRSVAVSYALQHNFRVLLPDLQMTSFPSAIFQFILYRTVQLIKYLPKVEVSLLVLTALRQYTFIRHMVLANTLHTIQPVQLKHSFTQGSNTNTSNPSKAQT